MNEKFDNTKPNVVLVTDVTDTYGLSKSFGVYKVAYELRNAGYQVFVLQHAHVFSVQEIFNLLSCLISTQTVFVGFNPMFYRKIKSFDYNIPSPADGDMVLERGDESFVTRMVGAMLPHGKDLNHSIKQHILKINPACKLVVGGPLAIDSQENKDFDFVVMGYADNSVTELANHLSHGSIISKCYRSIHGFTVINDETAENFDFANSTMSYMPYDGIRPNEMLPLELSRGCIFQCAFCSFPLNGKKKLDYIKGFELLYDELMNNYQKYGTTRYIFLDDTFNDSLEKITGLLEISRRLPFQLEYWTYLRLDLLLAHPETIDMIYESGCRSAHFGIETLNKVSGAAIGKGMPRDKIVNGIKFVKSKWKDCILSASFIVGLPHESIESVTETMDWLASDDCALDAYMVFPLTFMSHSTAKFTSKLEQNPEKYGYKNLRNLPESASRYWENDYMTYYQACDIANNYKDHRHRLSSITAYTISNLGFSVSELVSKPIPELDWPNIITAKWRAAREYKKMTFHNVGMDVGSVTESGLLQQS